MYLYIICLKSRRSSIRTVTAVRFGDRKITYAELNAKADELAKAIVSSSPASLVIGVSATRSIETIISLFAILKAGKAYLPLDPTFPADRLQDIVVDSGMDTILTPESVTRGGFEFDS
jgi:non-ribosomal peptide synthetase component F